MKRELAEFARVQFRSIPNSKVPIVSVGCSEGDNRPSPIPPPSTDPLLLTTYLTDDPVSILPPNPPRNHFWPISKWLTALALRELHLAEAAAADHAEHVILVLVGTPSLDLRDHVIIYVRVRVHT